MGRVDFSGNISVCQRKKIRKENFNPWRNRSHDIRSYLHCVIIKWSLYSCSLSSYFPFKYQKLRIWNQLLRWKVSFVFLRSIMFQSIILSECSLNKALNHNITPRRVSQTNYVPTAKREQNLWNLQRWKYFFLIRTLA